MLSDELIECSNNPNNCIGGFESGNDLCAEGTIGPLCESCDI